MSSSVARAGTNSGSRQNRGRHDTGGRGTVTRWMVTGLRDLGTLGLGCPCAACPSCLDLAHVEQRREIKTSPRQFDPRCRTLRCADLYQTPIF